MIKCCFTFQTKDTYNELLFVSDVEYVVSTFQTKGPNNLDFLFNCKDDYLRSYYLKVLIYRMAQGRCNRNYALLHWLHHLMLFVWMQ